MPGAIRTLPVMSKTLIGYARCSTDAQDLTAQRDQLRELGVAEERNYPGHELTGATRKRPGLDQALAAVRAGDTLVVPKLDRLARSVPDARAIGDDLAGRCIKLSPGGQVWPRPTRQGMATARAKGKLRGKQPKLPAKQQRELARMAATGEYTIADLAELFTVSRATVSPTLQRTGRRRGPVTGSPARASEQPQGFRTCTASVLPLIPAQLFLGPYKSF